MCRHLAYLGPSRSLASLLYDASHSLEEQSWKPLRQRAGAMNADGWGVGWWDPIVRPEPARYRTAAPMWTDRSFRSVAEVVHAGAFMAAVRSATPPSPIVQTGNAPFSAGRWLFSLNGYVHDFRGPIGEAMRRSVSEERAVAIEGTSDSEIVFALVLDALDGGATAEQALVAAIVQATARSEASLNLLLHDGQTVLATTFGNSLSVLRDTGLATGGVLVASEPLDDDPAWVDVPDHSVVRASCTELEISPLSAHGGPDMTRTDIAERCTIEVHLTEADLDEALRRDARNGLTATPKHVPPKWFYDERGSQLFDDITRLPEYYPTRKETEILERESGAIARRTGATSLVELGSGTSTKTKLLLDGLADAGTLARFVPFDVCEPVLVAAAPELASRYPEIRIDAVVGDFEQHLGRIPMEGTTVVAFLGGTIGNLAPPARAKFFQELTDQMAPGDWLLLGTDLVKDPARLIAAYDDSADVTAEFNRNVLHVLNRELQGDFSPYRFAHVAKWNKEAQWIEMHLRAEGDQHARLEAIDLDVDVADGEMIHTEISAKFTRQRVQDELAAAGLELDDLLTDSDGDFALSLARKA